MKRPRDMASEAAPPGAAPKRQKLAPEDSPPSGGPLAASAPRDRAGWAMLDNNLWVVLCSYIPYEDYLRLSFGSDEFGKRARDDVMKMYLRRDWTISTPSGCPSGWAETEIAKFYEVMGQEGADCYAATKAIWEDIRGWLKVHAPQVYATLRPPASLP